MDDNTDPATAPEGQGKNDVAAEGAATGTASNAGKLFNQEQVNSLVTARLAEERTRAEKKFADRLKAELEKATGDVDKLVETKLQEREALRALDAERAAIAEEYGLTEAQAKRLNGANPKELRADANELFGKFVSKPDPKVEMLKQVAEKTGLNEKQIARLTGDTEEAMIADAVELFGVKVATGEQSGGQDGGKEEAAKPKPPVLNPGGGAKPNGSALDLSSMSPEEIRKQSSSIWKTLAGN